MSQTDFPDHGAPGPGPGFLSPYRVLDLTDERGLLAGHLLAQLGADVIQVEPPGGSTARGVDPLDDRPAGLNSLFWDAYAAGKRGITLALDRPEGREQLLRLAARADILIESARPGEMQALGLDDQALRAVNPRLIHVSITAFGSTGPKAHYADADLVIWASSGGLEPHRTPDGLPLRISVPQAFHQASLDAVTGALIALLARGEDGPGQHVDVSAQESCTLCTLSSHVAAAVGHADFQPRGGVQSKKLLDLSGSGARTRKTKWEVRDGLVEMHTGMGTAAGRYTNAAFAWLRELGEVPDDIAAWDWVTIPGRIERGEVSLEDLERARAIVGRVFARFTKDELMEVAQTRGLLLAPVMSTGDLTRSRQLAARGFFTTVGEDERLRTLPAPFAAAIGLAPSLRPAPLPGEHNAEVLGEAQAFGHPAPAEPRAKTGRALEGLKVLDLSWVVAGPLIGRMLADFGATVVRVESSTRVETARLMGPFPDARFDNQKSLLFENCNAGKLGLTLDLGREDSREVVRDLARWADVAIESFRPGQMARFELDYPRLKAINPGLIMLSTSLLGQTGPNAQFAGFGNVGAALSGFQYLVGEPGELPIGPYGPYTDFVGPRFSLMALLAALDHRRRTGEGRRLDISQVESAIALLAPQIADYHLTGRVAEPQGNRDHRFAPCGAFPARGEDRRVAVVARDDGEWRRLATLIGGPALADDARFADFAGRKRHEDELEAIVAAWTSEREAGETEVILQAMGVPAYVVAATEDVMADAQLAARGHFVRLPHPLMGETIFDAARCQLSGTPATYERPAPHFGRDNQHVLADLLGYDQARIDRLGASGALS